MRSIRPMPALVGLAAALALTATACGPTEDAAADKPAASSPAAEQSGAQDGGGLPTDLADKLKKHGVDPDKWKNGEWKNWDKEKWLREASDFVNPVIEGLWDPERMKTAQSPDQTIAATSGTTGTTDPTPRPVRAQREKTPYTRNAAPVGKVFFDSPKGSMVCSATVVKDPRRPGKSNMVWTAGHCVHAGQRGGWYRNIAFVPAYNNLGKSPAALQNAKQHEIAPYGTYWADWAVTSGDWINKGGTNSAWAYDYAVLHVKPERGSKSLEETVGVALPVDFSAPAARQVNAMGAWGYPAAPPYNGLIMHKCVDRPGRLSVAPNMPTLYRIGCTMTGGSSGGGWFRTMPNGKLALVSNTSIGPAGGNGWLAGPQLGQSAKQAHEMVSKKFAK